MNTSLICLVSQLRDHFTQLCIAYDLRGVHLMVSIIDLAVRIITSGLVGEAALQHTIQEMLEHVKAANAEPEPSQGAPRGKA